MPKNDDAGSPTGLPAPFPARGGDGDGRDTGTEALAFEEAKAQLELTRVKARGEIAVKAVKQKNRISDTKLNTKSTLNGKRAPLLAAQEALGASFGTKIKNAEMERDKAAETLRAADADHRDKKAEHTALLRQLDAAQRLVKTTTISEDLDALKKEEETLTATLDAELAAVQATEEYETSKVEAAHEEALTELKAEYNQP